MNPYHLPPGNIQICFSGGRTSGYLLHEILEANGPLPDRAKVVFTNTGRELPETLDFVNECAQRWAVPVTWLEYARIDGKHDFREVGHNTAARHGEPFEALIEAKKYLPNPVTRFCTSELKVKTAKRYLQRAGWANWTSAIGIRADERHREKYKSKEVWVNWYPLIGANVDRAQITRFWAGQAFDLALLNINGKTPLGNCDGCFLKSEASLFTLCKTHPDRAKWWAGIEARTGSTFHKARSYQDLIDFAQNQGDLFAGREALLCQRSEGECAPWVGG